MAMVDEHGDRDVLAARLFGEIQAEGLRAASALVERLVHLVDGPHVASTAETEADDPAPGVGAVLPWFELWRDLVERTSDVVRRLDGGTTLAPTHAVTMTVDAGGSGQAEMWLHNGTGEDQGELVPHCGPLSDAYGNTLACDMDINPPKIEQLHSRSSRAFVISVTTGSIAAPGTYRGIVQVRGAAAVWTPIEVVVPS